MRSAAIFVFIVSATGALSADWNFWGANTHNTRDNPAEHRLSVENVSKLDTKWVFTADGDVTATPTVEGDAVYVPDWAGNLYKIDKDSGKVIWAHKLSEYTGDAKSLSRNSPAIVDNLAIFGDQASATVIAVNKHSGELVWKTLIDPNTAAIITTSPVVVHDRVYVGVSSNEEIIAARTPGFKLSFRGSVASLDLRTGDILWQFQTIPNGYTGGAVWGSTFAADPERGSLYVATGNNYSVPDEVATCIKGALSQQAQLACLSSEDYIDAVLALDLSSGKLKWVHRLQGADTWILSCMVNRGGLPCPDPAGPDFDFGSGPNLFTTSMQGRKQDILGAGQKSGVYWALNPDDGSVLWATMVGPGGTIGGIEWGSAVDGSRIYTAIANRSHKTYTLQPAGAQTSNGGSWAALDASTGKVNWQIAATGENPLEPGFVAEGLGAVTVANGVMYAGSMSGDMVAIDASNGNVLWKFASGGSVICGPSVVDGVVYWGSGYSHNNFGTGNNKLYAFTVK